MSQAILLSDSYPLQPEYTPFSDWVVCCTDAARDYRLLACYHFNYGGEKMRTFCTYGDTVFDFTFNGVKEIKKLTSQEKEQFTEMAKRASAVEQPLLSETAPDELNKTGGFCVGMTFEFLSHYHHSTKSDPIEKLKECYSLISEGATLNARMLQELSQRQNLDLLSQKKRAELDAWKEKVEEQKLFIDCDRNDLLNMYTIAAKYAQKQDEAVARLCNLNLEPSLLVTRTGPSWDDSKEAFNQLNDGVYFLEIRCYSRPEGHVTGFIMEKGHYFYMDPNFGILELNQADAFATIWDSALSVNGNEPPDIFFYRTYKIN